MAAPPLSSLAPPATPARIPSPAELDSAPPTKRELAWLLHGFITTNIEGGSPRDPPQKQNKAHGVGSAGLRAGSAGVSPLPPQTGIPNGVGRS